MDDGFLYNTDDTPSEAIMQKSNDGNADDSAPASKDDTNDIAGVVPENNIIEESTPTDEPASNADRKRH